MGDALDDGFEAYDLEVDTEEFADDDEPLIEAQPSKRKAAALDQGEGKKAKQAKKQKQKGQAKEGGEVEEVEEEEDAGQEDDDDEGAATADGEKKKKKKKKRKKKPKVLEPTAALTTAEAQSAYLWGRCVDLLNISPLDADVNRFPPTCFALPSASSSSSSSSSSAASSQKKKKHKQPAPTGHAQTPASHPGKGDANVTDFLQQAFPQLQAIASDKFQREMGHPFVLLLSSSAVRANELAKDLRVKLRNLKTAKLFAKHLKVTAQVEVLQSEFNALAVGTPNRLIKLLEMQAMSLSRCRLVVLDSSFKDSKAFDLLTLPGVAKDTALLLRDHVLPAMAARKGAKEAKEQLRLALF